MKTTSWIDKGIYWVSTVYVLLLMMWSFVIYHVQNDFMTSFFEYLGYPPYIIYPLAYLKLVAVLVIVTNRYEDVKEWVYVAYFFNVVLATSAYINAGELYSLHSYLALICVPLSYLYSNKVRGKPEKRLLNL